MFRLLTTILSIFMLSACDMKNNNADEEARNPILFVGTYTQKEAHVDGKGEGVYVFEMDTLTGALKYLNTSESVLSPSYLAVHPNGHQVYAVNEFDGGDNFATLTAFEYTPETHDLKVLNQVSSVGQYPCHISVDNQGQFVMAANYVGGSVVLYPIMDDGSLGSYADYKKHQGSSTHPRQEAPHAHQIVQHTKKGYVFAVDMGADKIYRYDLDSASMTLNEVEFFDIDPKMSGPRHMAFHPERDIVYVLNELIGTIKVTALTDSSTFIGNIQMVSTQQDGDQREPASAAIKVHPNGKYLYASNRGEINEIVIFRIGKAGELAKIGHQSTFGKTPRDFVIDPTGKFLLVANQDSDAIITFAIDQKTGLLTETGHELSVPTPVCLKFL